MGFDINRFKGEVDEEFICPICSGVLEEPLQAPICEHAFCKACINEWLSRKISCPIDREVITTNELKPPPRILRNLLSRLLIMCDNASSGCTAVVKLDQLGIHQQGCEYNPNRPVPCEQDYGFLVPKNEFEDQSCLASELRLMLQTKIRRFFDIPRVLAEIRDNRLFKSCLKKMDYEAMLSFKTLQSVSSCSKMGYDIARFKGEVDEELICPICSGVLQEPLQAPICEHAFCKVCLNEWLSRKNSCPVDREVIAPNELKPPPRILRNLLSRLLIMCDNASLGCTAVVKLEQLGIHQQGCEWNPNISVPCEQACGLMVPKNKLKEHNCLASELSLMFQTKMERLRDLKREVEELGRDISLIMSRFFEMDYETIKNHFTEFMSIGSSLQMISEQIGNLSDE
ncbi:E3 ubiquitin-protein ligase NRDP1 [Araneus ventricosus]|uniref:E3 ubiquitin-protein ligase NRDP1 n=1 Tax=Araneus ventricosus TaxID=182803 RepID=A0A4Y2HXE1_ARAVE|nr:E3 ubiquitin-protein ligase NRDP1 [Araneus ventricosus]